MRKRRRIAVRLIALAVALAPAICVCAGTMAPNKPATAVIDNRADCHSDAPAPEVADDEPCSGCDDSAPASLSKSHFDTADQGLFVLDFPTMLRFAKDPFAAPFDHHRQFRHTTPVTLKVVLLN
jgi:hypothetical protein